jgi:hypothetical protein
VAGHCNFDFITHLPPTSKLLPNISFPSSAQGTIISFQSIVERGRHIELTWPYWNHNDVPRHLPLRQLLGDPPLCKSAPPPSRWEAGGPYRSLFVERDPARAVVEGAVGVGLEEAVQALLDAARKGDEVRVGEGDHGVPVAHAEHEGRLEQVHVRQQACTGNDARMVLKRSLLHC